VLQCEYNKSEVEKMAKSEFMNIRIAPELKRKVEILFDEMGLTTSDAVTLFFSQVVNRGEIPFIIKAKVPNAETLQALAEADKIASGEIKKQGMSVNDFFTEMSE
jgi:DNA-damage-inducible protein J